MSDAFPPLQGYPRETVMTQAELAGALRVHPSTIGRSRIPVTYGLGSQSPRYVWGLVIDFLTSVAEGGEIPARSTL